MKPFTQQHRLILLFTAFMVCGALDLCAQENCLVRYNYDAAGNRVKRYWYCLGHEEDKSLATEGNLAGNGLSLFPVPANTNLEVRLDSAVVSATIEVSDAQGKVQLTQRMSGTQHALDVTSLSNGMYHVRVTQGREYFLSSFTVQH